MGGDTRPVEGDQDGLGLDTVDAEAHDVRHAPRRFWVTHERHPLD